MSVIVTDSGFQPEDFWAETLTPAEAETAPGPFALDLDAGVEIATLRPLLGRAALIRVRFETFADGRGFTLARALRRAGYRGRLRATGHVIADQYAMARRAGFDEVEIDDALAARQPEAQWQARADWRAHDHQSRLRG